MIMDASDLRIFEAVARHAGMNRAAMELNTVQSNVTARIRQIEDRLGTQLFERHSRGVSLTAAGRRLLPYANRITQLLEEAERAVGDDGTPKGRLTVGSLETTAMVRLPNVLAVYAATYPAVDLAITTGTSVELVARVIEGRLEGAFVVGPVEHPELAQEPIYREELAIVAAPGIRRLSDILQRNELKIVVLRIGCSYRQRLENFLARRGVVGLRYLEFGTLDAILGCVSAGIGITLLPKSVVDQARRERRISVHPLPAQEARVETVFIHRKDVFITSALDAFVKCARRNGNNGAKPAARRAPS